MTGSYVWILQRKNLYSKKHMRGYVLDIKLFVWKYNVTVS